MFNFFGKKKEKAVTVADKIWLSEAGKWQACANQAKDNGNTIIAVWFDDSFQKLEMLFSKEGLSIDKIIMARELARNYIENASLIFAEHYPLSAREEELYEKLGLKNVTVYSSLDEPLFNHFGGNKIIELAKHMGMKEDEAMEHKLISSSIKNAQEKIHASISFEQTAHSQADWFLKNMNRPV